MPGYSRLSFVESTCTLLSCTSENWSEVYDNHNLNTKVLADDVLGREREKLKAASCGRYRLDKLLDAMLEHAISDDGKRYVAVALHIAHNKGGDAVVNVTQAWMDYLFLPMLTVSVKISKVESSGSQTLTLDRTAQAIESASRSDQSDLRDKVRKREGYRCPLTGNVDRKWAHDLRIKGDWVVPEVSGYVEAAMDAAHIIPFSLNDFKDDSNSSELRDVARTQEMLRAWTNLDIDQLVGPRINTPANAICMSHIEHNDFGNFRFYFDQGAFPQVPNKYRVRMAETAFRLSNGKDSVDVEFKTVDGIEPPNPEFLRVHAAFAQVLHLSRAAEYMDRVQTNGERPVPLFMHPTNDFEMILSHRLAALAN